MKKNLLKKLLYFWPIAHYIIEICNLILISAIQWQRCTDSALSGLEFLSDNNHITIKYEDIAKNHQNKIFDLFEFIGLNISRDVSNRILNYIENKSLGRWKSILTENDIETIMPYINKTMINLNYL